MTALPVGSLTDLLRVRAATLVDRHAYGFLADGDIETDTLSYAGLDRAARALAARLAERVAPGASVLLAYPSGLEFIVAFFGCLYAGVIGVPVCAPHPRKGNERLAAIAADAEARHLLTTSAGAGLVSAAAAQVGALRALEVVATGLETGDEAGGAPLRATSGEAIALLQYTSGSTRSPRGVIVTHANLLANLASIHAAEGNGEHSRGVSWLPAYHDMGLIEGILQPLFGGYPAWLMPHAAFLQRPARWLGAISRFGATVSGGPNFAYDACVRRVSDAELAQLDLSSWQVAYCGAEPVRAGTLDAFAERFGACGMKRAALRPVYGLAEATLLVTASERDAPGPRFVAARKSGLEHGRFQPAQADERDPAALVSCGRPVPGTRLLIVDTETGAVLPERAIGEISVQGPGVTRGYRSADAEGRAMFVHNGFVPKTLDGARGSWLRTGDLGFLLDGELYVSGRTRDLIILRGRKLHPQDIEHTVASSSAGMRVDGVAAFALEAAGGEGLVICAELARSLSTADAPDAQGALALLSDAIRDRIYREHDVAVAVVALVRPGALARTTSGKLMRFRLRQDFATGRLPIIACFDARPGVAVDERVV